MECGSGRTFQNANASYVFGVNVGGTVRSLRAVQRTSGAPIGAVSIVANWNTIYYKQRLITTCQRRDTTDVDVSRSPGQATSRSNRYARNLTLQGI